MIQRTLEPSLTRSFFLFGPRQTGKSTFVRALLQPHDLYLTLLSQATFLSYARHPQAFRQEVLAHHQKHGSFTCVVDEIQKIPLLLDEIHDLIESYRIRFVMTGSSARKIKHGGANLLAGRAHVYQMYPLTVAELGENFELEKALRLGCLPYLWSQELTPSDELDFLRSYADVYLREEIQAEGIVRNIGPFARFMDIAAANDGEIVNYSNIARECGLSVKTVQAYYQILEDTFLSHRLPPWMRSARKRLVAHPKYYGFDTGVTNALCHLLSDSLNPVVRGRRFEQFIILQCIALNAYHRGGLQFFFWRTHTGVEVDLLITRGEKPLAAVEIKSSAQTTLDDTYGLRELRKEYPDIKPYLVCPLERPRLLTDTIQAVPWRVFLEETLPGFFHS